MGLSGIPVVWWDDTGQFEPARGAAAGRLYVDAGVGISADPIADLSGLFRVGAAAAYSRKGEILLVGMEPAGWLFAGGGCGIFCAVPRPICIESSVSAARGQHPAGGVAGGRDGVGGSSQCIYRCDWGRAGLAGLPVPAALQADYPGMGRCDQRTNLGSLAHAAYLYGLGLWSGLSRLSLGGGGGADPVLCSDERVDWLADLPRGLYLASDIVP